MKAMNEGRIVVLGNSSIDDIVTADGVFHQNVCGGNCFHASMAAGIMSDKVAILANVPENFPRENIDKLRRHGIDTSLLKVQSKAVEYQELFVYQENGDRIDGLFLNLDSSLDGKRISPQKRDELLAASRTDVYSYKDFRNEFPPDPGSIPQDWNVLAMHIAPTALAVHEKALSMDVPIKTLDPGRYLVGMPYGDVVDLVSRSTVFAPSRKEMRYIFPEGDIVSSTMRLGLDAGTNVVCKNGRDGCMVFEYETRACYIVGTYPERFVANLTGAGDSFCGALNASLAEGHALIDAVRIATVVAAKAIEVVSATDRAAVNRDFVLSEFDKVGFKEVDADVWKKNC